MLYLILALKHLGSSLLEPMLYFLSGTVHTNELLNVTAMLLVVNIAYNFVSEDKCTFYDGLTVLYLLPVEAWFSISSLKIVFNLETILLNRVALHFSLCLILFSSLPSGKR